MKDKPFASRRGERAAIPQHVAIIMDGNGRWAQMKGLPRIAGHRAGVESVREMVKASLEVGVPILTLYAFSQENWKRPKEEIALLMDLLDFFLNRELKNFQKKGVRFRTIGRVEALPAPVLQKVRQAEEFTKQNDKLILNVALNYGARTEIVDAVRKILDELVQGKIRVNGSAPPFGGAVPPNGGADFLTEEFFARHLYTADLPDPDLLIRTSGEMRLSNFLLWQLSYSEIYITKKYWPDFKKEDYFKAIREYGRRERRFGGVG